MAANVWNAEGINVYNVLELAGLLRSDTSESFYQVWSRISQTRETKTQEEASG